MFDESSKDICLAMCFVSSVGKLVRWIKYIGDRLNNFVDIGGNGGNIGIGFAITASTVDRFLKGDLKNGELMPPAPEVSGGGGYGGSGAARGNQDQAVLNFGRKSVEGDANPFAFPRRVVAEADGFPKVTKWL